MNEFEFLQQFVFRQPERADVVLGVGDDAAVLRPKPGTDWCISTDMLVGGRHFFVDVAPEDLAHKVLAVNVSDMAAMGAKPAWAVLSAALPALEEHWLTRFFTRFSALAAEYGVALIGGDTTRGDWVFNLTIGGELPAGQALRRSGARVGDEVWVSGELGLAAAALQARLRQEHGFRLPETVLAACEECLLRPQPRVALGRALLPLAHAALDISDGLAQDVGHIARASGVGIEINVDAVPTLPALKTAVDEEVLLPLILGGGDDYELAFTAAPEHHDAIQALQSALDLPLHCIGTVVAGAGVRLKRGDGSDCFLEQHGYDHFKV